MTVQCFSAKTCYLIKKFDPRLFKELIKGMLFLSLFTSVYFFFSCDHSRLWSIINIFLTATADENQRFL